MTKHVENLITAVDETHGREALAITLNMLSKFFHDFAREADFLFNEDPENNRLSQGYRFAAYWCESWTEELND